jgi:probable HAF family extracellular repeat protein
MRPQLAFVVLACLALLAVPACGGGGGKRANQEPIASISPYFEHGFVAAVMRFDGSSSADPDGRVVGWAWNFGDGSTSEGAVANHRYAAVGVYVVQLTVRDDSGASGVTQSTVRVRSEDEFPAYQMLDLGTLGGAKSDGLAINAVGQVTGYAQTADGYDHAFIVAVGQSMIDLSPEGSERSFSRGTAINDAGQVTGSAGGNAFLATPGQPMVGLGVLVGDHCSEGLDVNASGQVVGFSGGTATSCDLAHSHAFEATPGQPLIDLLGGRYGAAHAINDAGQVAGSAARADGKYSHAFVTAADGTAVDLGTLGGEWSYGSDINNAGQVTGNAQTADGDPHAFVAGTGQPMIDLGTLGGRSSDGLAINDSGQVTGVAQLGGYYHAFVAGAGQAMIDLGTLGGRFSGGYDINIVGQVTGISETADGSLHAFVAADGQPMIDLGTLGEKFSWGRAINDAGQVTGLFGASELEGRAFLATPIALLFSQLIDSTAAVPAASGLIPLVTAAQTGYEDKDLPTSCERLGQYDVAVTERTPGQIPEFDADRLLSQSSAIAGELDCP